LDLSSNFLAGLDRVIIELQLLFRRGNRIRTKNYPGRERLPGVSFNWNCPVRLMVEFVNPTRLVTGVRYPESPMLQSLGTGGLRQPS